MPERVADRPTPAPTRARAIVLLAAAVALLAAGAPGHAAAQRSVRVVDADGRPVPSVRIDVFGTGELIAVDSTDADGVVELATERWAEVRRISLSHLGFQTRIVQAADIVPGGVIRMEPVATEIEGLEVTGRELCPVTDDPAARRLWEDVAARYATDTGSRAWSAYMSRFWGGAREGQLHVTSSVEPVDYIAAGGPGTIHGGDHTPRPLAERVTTEGYAWPPLEVAGTTGSFTLSWMYPSLHLYHAYHFASPVFGALHDLAIATEASDGVTLAFCPNGSGPGATIRGTIRLMPEEAFLAADWRFETPGEDEGAGGTVTFASYVESPRQPPHLVSARGYVYRYRSLDRPYPDLPRDYARRGVTAVRWMLHPTGDRPCNSGRSYFLDPPGSPEGERFTACIERHWTRE